MLHAFFVNSYFVLSKDGLLIVYGLHFVNVNYLSSTVLTKTLNPSKVDASYRVPKKSGKNVFVFMPVFITLLKSFIQNFNYSFQILPVTITWKEQVAELPEPSVTVYVTTVVPSVKRLPDIMLELAVRVSPELSTTVGSSQVAVVFSPMPANTTFTVSGQVSVGSSPSAKQINGYISFLI